MSLIPEDLRYSKEHMWVRMKDGEAVIGMTDYAQAQMDGISYMRIPSAGSHLAVGEVCGMVESSKPTKDLICPVKGEVVEANVALDSTPELCNKDPYGKGWILRIKTVEAPKDLMDAAAYADFCKTAAK